MTNVIPEKQKQVKASDDKKVKYSLHSVKYPLIEERRLTPSSERKDDVITDLDHNDDPFNGCPEKQANALRANPVTESPSLQSVVQTTKALVSTPYGGSSGLMADDLDDDELTSVDIVAAPKKKKKKKKDKKKKPSSIPTRSKKAKDKDSDYSPERDSDIEIECKNLHLINNDEQYLRSGRSTDTSPLLSNKIMVSDLCQPTTVINKDISASGFPSSASTSYTDVAVNVKNTDLFSPVINNIAETVLTNVLFSPFSFDVNLEEDLPLHHIPFKPERHL